MNDVINEYQFLKVNIPNLCDAPWTGGTGLEDFWHSKFWWWNLDPKCKAGSSRDRIEASSPRPGDIAHLPLGWQTTPAKKNNNGAFYPQTYNNNIETKGRRDYCLD